MRHAVAVRGQGEGVSLALTEAQANVELRAEPCLSARRGMALLIGFFIYLPRKIRTLEAARDRFEALVDDRTLR